MKLRIKAPDGERVVTLPPDGSALIAGRGQQATLHLPDPERALSREHASLRASGTGVAVEVVSRSLGVATSRGALGPGERGQLEPGDSLTMGAYILVIEPADVAATPPWPPAEATEAVAASLYRVSPSSGPQKPLGFSEGGAPGREHGSADMGIRTPGPMSEPEGDALQTIQQFLQPAPAEPPRGRRPLPPLVVTPTPVANAAHTPRRAPPGPAPDAADTPPVARPPVGPVAAAPALPAVPSWQQKKLDIGASSPLVRTTGPSWQSPQPAGRGADPTGNDVDMSGQGTVATYLQGQPEIVPQAGAMPGTVFLPPVPQGDAANISGLPVQHVKSEPASDPAADASTVALPRPSPGAALTPDLQSFAEGLGLPAPSTLTPADWQRIGSTLRQLVDAMNQLMQDRAALKSELRMNRTERYLSENNPYKADIALDDLLRHLICGEGTGSAFMPADAAVREAADDLRAHNLAIIAASRASVEGTLREFSPDQLRKHLSVTRAAKVVALMEHGQLWRSYMAYYEQKSTHMGDWLDAMFEKHFVDTYTQEALRLNQQHISLP